MVRSLSHIRLSMTPWTAARQASLSVAFPREERWSGLPFPSPGDLPDPGIKPISCIVGRRFTLWATRKTKTLVFSCMELSHDIPKVCLSLVSGPCYASFLHSARLPCAVPKRTCWGKKSGRRSFSALGAQVSLWGGEYSCPPACPTRGLLLGQHREGPLSLEGYHGPGSSQFMLGINWKSDMSRQQQQSPNYSKLRVRVFGKSQLPHAALRFPSSGSKSWALFCVCFMNLLSTQYPVCVVHMLAKY